MTSHKNDKSHQMLVTSTFTMKAIYYFWIKMPISGKLLFR